MKFEEGVGMKNPTLLSKLGVCKSKYRGFRPENVRKFISKMALNGEKWFAVSKSLFGLFNVVEQNFSTLKLIFETLGTRSEEKKSKTVNIPNQPQYQKSKI